VSARQIERWYAQYWAQSWYRNTYLVEHPRQIGRQRGGERDWNNIHDSGCNFTCIAMMVGIDPARLASELGGRKQFFKPDRETPGRTLDGRRRALVWDCNAPHARLRSFALSGVWLAELGRRATLRVQFVAEELTFDHKEGCRIVRAARRRREHVIAGASDHSHLVAGRIAGDFYLWDPDETSVLVECSLAGRIRLADLFAYYVAREPIAFWRYRVERKIHPTRAPPKNWRYGR
jgi:hypothetical protein